MLSLRRGLGGESALVSQWIDLLKFHKCFGNTTARYGVKDLDASQPADRKNLLSGFHKWTLLTFQLPQMSHCHWKCVRMNTIHEGWAIMEKHNRREYFD